MNNLLVSPSNLYLNLVRTKVATPINTIIMFVPQQEVTNLKFSIISKQIKFLFFISSRHGLLNVWENFIENWSPA